MYWAYLHEILLPLFVATVLGGVVGLEREVKGRWAGLRTHMLVALGVAMLIVAGRSTTESAPSELSRIIQGVATGIGFIGAGTILKLSTDREVKGLTTASSVWAAAGIGIAVGLGMYPLAATGTVFCLLVLYLLGHMEKRLIDKDCSHEEDTRN